MSAVESNPRQSRLDRMLAFLHTCRMLAFYAEGNRLPKSLLAKLGIPAA